MDGRDCVVYDFRYDDHIGIRIVHTDVLINQLIKKSAVADFFICRFFCGRIKRRAAARLFYQAPATVPKFIIKQIIDNFYKIYHLHNSPT